MCIIPHLRLQRGQSIPGQKRIKVKDHSLLSPKGLLDATGGWYTLPGYVAITGQTKYFWHVKNRVNNRMLSWYCRVALQILCKSVKSDTFSLLNKSAPATSGINKFMVVWWWIAPEAHIRDIFHRGSAGIPYRWYMKAWDPVWHHGLSHFYPSWVCFSKFQSQPEQDKVGHQHFCILSTCLSIHTFS